MRKSFLKLEIIWEDDDLIELKVTVAGSGFCGTTFVYDTSECLSKLAENLKGFPSTDKALIHHESGEKNGYSFYSIRLYQLDNRGILGAEITLEENTAGRESDFKSKMSVEIKVEPNSVDEFQKRLAAMGRNRSGSAILLGRDSMYFQNDECAYCSSI